MARKKLIPDENHRPLPARKDPEYDTIYQDDYWRPEHEEENQLQNRLTQEMHRLSKAIGPDYFIQSCYELTMKRDIIRQIRAHLATRKDREMLAALQGMEPFPSIIQEAFSTDGRLIRPGPVVIKIGGPLDTEKTFYRIRPGKHRDQLIIQLICGLDKNAFQRATSQLSLSTFFGIFAIYEEYESRAKWHEIILAPGHTFAGGRLIVWRPVESVREGLEPLLDSGKAHFSYFHTTARGRRRSALRHALGEEEVKAYNIFQEAVDMDSHPDLQALGALLTAKEWRKAGELADNLLKSLGETSGILGQSPSPLFVWVRQSVLKGAKRMAQEEEVWEQQNRLFKRCSRILQRASSCLNGLRHPSNIRTHLNNQRKILRDVSIVLDLLSGWLHDFSQGPKEFL